VKALDTIMMEKMRKMMGLPRMRVPTYAQLWDGTWWAKEVEAEGGVSWVVEFETRLAQAQEVALWSRPIVSLAWLLVTQAFVYHITSSAVLPNVAKLSLVVFLYTTWVYRVWPAIRVPPEHPEDEEDFTPLHPDVLSAPEMAGWVKAGKKKMVEVVHGQVVLRKERPAIFCLVSSVFCCLLAVIGMQTSTAGLLHISVFLALTLPALLVRASKVPAIAPWLEFCADFLGGLGDLCTYRGENAPPLENKELDEFVPEVNNETESFLATALSYVQRRDTDEDTSLTAGMAIPSHEEVEFESPAHGNPEVDLLPVAALALDHRVEDDSESECGDLVGQLALPGVGDSSGEEDSLDLEPSMGPVMSMVTSSVTSVTTTASSVSAATSNLFGSFLAKADSEPDLEDFELVDGADLDLESP